MEQFYTPFVRIRIPWLNADDANIEVARSQVCDSSPSSYMTQSRLGDNFLFVPEADLKQIVEILVACNVKHAIM